MNFDRQESGWDICQGKGRSLRSLPPVHAPSLVIYHGTKYQHQTFCIPSDGSYNAKSVPEMRGMSCDACSYGWLFLRSYFSSECYLFNPATLNKIDLPLLETDYGFVVLTSPPSDPDCLIMLFSERKNSCIFCRIGDTTWTEQEVERTKKDGRAVIKEYYSAISCEGKIYLFYDEGVAFVDVQDAVALIEPYNIREPISSLPSPGWMTRYIIESHGEIFLVLKISLGLSSIVQHFDVFKLDLSTMSWNKVDNLGDMIFLLSETYSLSVSASSFGAKGNCIYLFAKQRRYLYCFDMDDNSITITQPGPTKLPQWDGPFWVVPDCEVQVKKEVQVVKVTENQVYKEEWGQLKDLEIEHLQMIFQSLVLGDCIRFRLVCKFFMAMTPLPRPFDLSTQSDPQRLPWLISLANNKNDVCHFYHPIYDDPYVMNIPQLEGAIVHQANFGWLLLTKAINSSVFFFNPLTTETITLPESRLNLGYRFENISFSAPPTSSDCVVFCHRKPCLKSLLMFAYRMDENRWIEYDLDVPYTFVPSHCSPIFHGGVFYSLGKDGMLGVYNPNGEDNWRICQDLPVPDVSSSSPESICEDSSRSFITESDGEIFSVFMGYVGKPVSVYKLVQSGKKMKWIKVQSLGDKVMFVSRATSLLMPAKLKGTENRIYLPRFKKNASMFYSLKSGNYHSFGKQDSQADWIDSSEHWNCTWFRTQ